MRDLRFSAFLTGFYASWLINDVFAAGLPWWATVPLVTLLWYAAYRWSMRPAKPTDVNG
jgi:hypothetical protein